MSKRPRRPRCAFCEKRPTLDHRTRLCLRCWRALNKVGGDDEALFLVGARRARRFERARWRARVRWWRSLAGQIEAAHFELLEFSSLAPLVRLSIEETLTTLRRALAAPEGRP